jgi:hypothetical protein
MSSPVPPSRRRRLRLGVTVAVVVAALVGGGVAYLTLSGSPDWYATGKSAELDAEQQNDAFLVGPVSTLPTACTAKMSAAESGQRPARVRSTGSALVLAQVTRR